MNIQDIENNIAKNDKIEKRSEDELRKPSLTLRHLNKLRKIRELRKLEQATQSKQLALIYGDLEPSQTF